MQEVCHGVELMGSSLLQEVTLVDLFHLPCGSIVFEILVSVYIGTPISRGEKDARVMLLGWLTCRCRCWKDISSRPSWLAMKDGDGS